ncbi:MAG TPA: hypothetical protein VF771_18430, partial [Longimicrobiaceae bacterium]
DAPLAGGVWSEDWTFRARPGEQVDVTADPDSFSARVEWLRLEGGRWKVLEQALSRDAGGDAQLTVTPPDNGEYKIRVRNRRAGEAGLYTLRVSTGARELQPGATAVSSRLSGADAARPGDAPAETWAYRGAPDEPVALTLTSRARAALEWGHVVDGRWEPLARVVSSGAPGTLQVRPPATGEYLVRVHGFQPGDTARYQLSAVPNPPVGALQPGETAYGTLDEGDPQADGKYYEQWSFTGTPGEPVLIALRSAEFDPVLTFGCWTADGVWEEAGRNDDAEGGRDSVLQAYVRGSGECVVRAASYYAAGVSGPWAGLGSYTLTITAQDAPM